MLESHRTIFELKKVISRTSKEQPPGRGKWRFQLHQISFGGSLKKGLREPAMVHRYDAAYDAPHLLRQERIGAELKHHVGLCFPTSAQQRSTPASID